MRSQIMGTGNFGRYNSNITVFTMRLFNEAKYLEPPLPFQSFVRHISKHLPREVQITLMTREVSNISELENMLDVFQSIRDREVVRHPQQPNVNRGGSYTQQGGQHTGTTYHGREPSRRYPMWRCGGCPMENYADRNFCYRCKKARPGHQNRTQQRYSNPHQRTGEDRAEMEGENCRAERVYTCLLYTSRCV